ncbi:phosphoribosylaminoimidazolesuccinocarboxamide synthase [Piscibacillus halophilus]|uniref:phosphoribosylaminoimidazolesuccinocarboxamide synthase n=1 Tax=Piscibacillus halophilus TaxID=571933 RepID=UPI00158B37A7|nr:phosphoribosylaminoimidazolesuccinocarboxamide synthase [Piscibacillus halophilus]
MQKGQLVYEGKAKRLYETEYPDVLVVEYKNALTAFNGQKKAEEQGKGALNNKISSILFERLHQAGVANHWVKQISEDEQLVKHTKIIPIEVVVRNVAAGSLAKRLGLTEGHQLGQTVVEYYYKDDELGDPLINEDHIKLLNLVDSDDLARMKDMALVVNDCLLDCFKQCDLKLIDFKLEFGYDRSGELMLSDEISPDTCRLWDIETNEKLDKDVFRKGIGSVEKSYSTVLERLKGAVSNG